ncbi:MAG: hypothetical protein HY717_19715 [Planctomycetes bacterium]|nr:hypothetical protein [Planctomycetota bacterium]
MNFIPKIHPWHLFFLGLLSLPAAIGFQLLASYLLSRQGLGIDREFKCLYCPVLVCEANGVYLPGHYFHVGVKRVINQGDPGCTHDWKNSGFSIACGSCHPLYFPLLKASHWLFILSPVLVLASLLLKLWRGRAIPPPI